MVVLLVGRERDGWMVAFLVGEELDGGAVYRERALDCWMVALLVKKVRVGRLDGEAAGWEGESGTAGWWRCWLGGRELDGWMVALLVGRETAGRLDNSGAAG